MKIRFGDLPWEGLKVDEVISLEGLNARLQEGSSHGIEFLAAPRVELTMRRTQGGAEARGRVTGRFRQPCALCIEGIERHAEVPLNYTFKPRPEETAGALPEDEYTDDIGVVFFTGEHIELEGLVQEALILSFSIYWHPPIDPFGKCSQCGLTAEQRGMADKEQAGGTVLADLLKNAGIKQ